MAPHLNFAPFRTHYFFLLTAVLAIVAWFITFVSQSVSTAQFGNRFVGVLWFAIFLQLFLTAGVVCAIATDSIQTVRIQIAVFAAMATIFSVEGVQQGIFSSLPAVFIMGTGYLFLAIVDIFWVLYFTSEKDSFTMRLFNYLGTGGLAQPGPQLRKTIQGTSIAADVSTDLTDKPDYSKGAGVSSRDIFGPQEGKRASTNSSLAIQRTNLSRSNTSLRLSTSRKSLVGSVHSIQRSDMEQSVPPMSVDSVPPLPELPASASSPSQPKSAGSTSAPVSPIASPDLVSSSAAAPAAEKEEKEDIEEEVLIRAKALHAYKGAPEDPNELSFAKGEILEIEDQEGKWWPAYKADGTRGIVPSNYLVILPAM